MKISNGSNDTYLTNSSWAHQPLSKVGVQIGKHKHATTEGVPQGGPLLSVLANVVLDELNWELEGRGYYFARHTDDCNIFVKSHSGPVF